MSIIITLLILGLIILIHELGHFATAKFFKMPVKEFAVGMGPALCSYDNGITKYSLRMIPLGGYVNIDGMEIDKPVENGFNSKPAIQRFIVLFAGVFMNFILALIIMISLAFYQGGEYVENNQPIIGEISDWSNAKDKLQKGDLITTVNNNKIVVWADVSKAIPQDKVSEVSIMVKRDNKNLSFKVKTRYDEKLKRALVGIGNDYKFKKYSVGETFNAGLRQYKDLFFVVGKGFKMLFSGQVKPKEITGPIGMVKVVKKFSMEGPIYLIWLTALLSINIGMFNLLPFPALDGGRIIFVIMELIGIKANKKMEENLHRVGIIMLLILFVLITGNDIINLFK